MAATGRSAARVGLAGHLGAVERGRGGCGGGKDGKGSDDDALGRLAEPVLVVRSRKGGRGRRGGADCAFGRYVFLRSFRRGAGGLEHSQHTDAHVLALRQEIESLIYAGLEDSGVELG